MMFSETGYQTMWIVNLALRRPYTFIVVAIFILISGLLAILRTPKDIFPSINIPVVSVIWTFSGMQPSEIENHITSVYERILTTTVDNIEHIESESLSGVAVVKIFLQPTANVSTGVAQVTAISQNVLKQLPPGITPPLVLSYSASNVPVLRLGLSGQKFSEQELNDFALNFVRTQLVTVPGASVPYPYGGKQKFVEINLNYQALQARGITPADVVNAVNAENLILPSGTAKIGQFEYQVGLNSSPPTIDELNTLPIKTVNGATIYLRDVGNVLSGNTPQTNVVRFNGSRATMLDIIKNGNASTLDVVQGIKNLLPRLKQTLPDGLDTQFLSDQSLFVTASIDGVLREATIAGLLTALMILIFLGDWRSTVIIAISIPLSILVSIVILSALDETINIMTLGGLALAVGILVDDATVTIENIHRHMGQGKPTLEAIRDGATQIVFPALVSTLCICIVFVPIFSLSGVAKFLFTPMAESVIFAMFGSFILSRSLVPTLCMFWLKGHHGSSDEQPRKSSRMNLAGRFYQGFNRRFEVFREGYRDFLSICLRYPGTTAVIFVGFSLLSMGLLPFLGQNFFPAVDAGQFDLHVRMRSGTRIEETARRVDLIEQMIRQVIPSGQLDGIIDNLGIPYSGINLSYNTTGTVSAADGDILVSLRPEHEPTNQFIRRIRQRLEQDFPDVTYWFPAADIVSQILNFGLPAPIDIQIVGADRAGNSLVANELAQRIRSVAGAVDVRVQEPSDTPRFDVTADRTKASILGITQQQIASSVLTALSGSQQTSFNFWVDSKNGVSYQINAQVPQYQINSLDALRNLPILGGTGALQILGNMSNISRSETSPIVDHYNIRPVINIYANADGKDLGYVSDQINNLVQEAKGKLPRGSFIDLRGQVLTMHDSFIGLGLGLIFSVVLIYLLMVVNFHSWVDPLVIITALPCALAGIVWMLFITGTTLSVPALMGAIMCMGVATANSVLVVTFAKEQLNEHRDSYRAALQAGYIRIRPVLMTALAMIIGMAPMALGLGEGGEQNAPLGRAVIGGLMFATVATLLFVPSVFMSIRKRRGSGQSLESIPGQATL
jgi:multidrug efflux pump subunit AcrB